MDGARRRARAASIVQSETSPTAVLLIGATADPFEGDSVEIERALTDLGVRNGGARSS